MDDGSVGVHRSSDHTALRNWNAIECNGIWMKWPERLDERTEATAINSHLSKSPGAVRPFGGWKVSSADQIAIPSFRSASSRRLQRVVRFVLMRWRSGIGNINGLRRWLLASRIGQRSSSDWSQHFRRKWMHSNSHWLMLLGDSLFDVCFLHLSQL